MKQTKSILVLGRRDPTEAMRVAAGLTIFNHRLSVLFLVAVPSTPENAELMELLEFSDVPSRTTIAAPGIPQIGTAELAAALAAADEVINL